MNRVFAWVAAWVIGLAALFVVCVGINYATSKIPCSWYSTIRAQSVPARCLSAYLK